MKVKLKTLEQLKEEFGFEFNKLYCETCFNGMRWIISYPMFKQLGKVIEVEKIDGDKDYTHCDNEGYLWHELWFEPVFTPIEFINEDEFEL